MIKRDLVARASLLSRLISNTLTFYEMIFLGLQGMVILPLRQFQNLLITPLQLFLKATGDIESSINVHGSETSK